MALRPLQPDGPQAEMLRHYAPRPGTQDELVRPDGAMSPAWADFLAHISRLSPEDLADRFARGDQYLRDAGVLFRKYDEAASTERDWPLSHIPVILEESEWTGISRGLIQRATLLESVVSDLYGDNRLVATGKLPAALVAQNPAWLRPLVGMKPGSGTYLNFLSFEIGRGPNGKWWVLGDMVEAPSGAGYAIENRAAMARVFPNYFARTNIYRLAGFFRDFQKSLFAARGGDDGQIAILSPGAMNDSYFEHAYIARYLGMLLVEGEDLIVRDGQVMVRTVGGPKPVSLLWRRLSGPLCDPLELDAGSRLGVPGLVDAVRRETVSIVNALGVGVLETRALMAFLPKIAQGLLNERLAIPNIATWWCGQDNELAHVIANRDKMMIGSAFSTRPLIEDRVGTFLATEFKGHDPEAVTRDLRARGDALVGQEAVTLSTTPAWENGKLVPRPMCLRVFLGRTADGWQVMPGGYARVSVGEDAKAFAMQRGGKVADVWIVSDTPVARPSLLQKQYAPPLRGALPSRAADNLFWLGRYMERAEFNMRLFRAYYARIRDGAAHDLPLLVHLRTRLMGEAKAEGQALAALFETPLHNALDAASRIGDRFSTDGMAALRELVHSANRLHEQQIPDSDKTSQSSALLRQVTGFSGLVHENMHRSLGWRFLSLGLSIERAANMCLILSELATTNAPYGALDLAIELGDSVMSHRAEYSIDATPQSVLGLLAFDPQNPRAILYHLTSAKNHIGALPRRAPNTAMTATARHALLLETSLVVETPATLNPRTLSEMQREIWALSDLITTEYLS